MITTRLNTYIAALCVLLFLSSSTAFALRSDYNLVTDIGTSAQMIGTGQVEGFGDGPSELMNNTASLYRIQRQNGLSLFSTTFIDEVHYTLLAYSRKTDYGTIGVAVMDAQVFDIPHTATANSPTQGEVFTVKEYFNYREAIYKLSHQFSLSPKWHFGSSLAYYNKDYFDVNGTGFNLDVGTIYVNDDYELSIAARNIVLGNRVGFTRSSDKQFASYENIPFQFVTGIKYDFDLFNLYGQTKWQNDEIIFNTGADYRPEAMPYLVLSGGYKEYLVLDRVKANYVIGLGLDLQGVRLSYAYEKGEHIEFDNKSYFSVDMQF